MGAINEVGPRALSESTGDAAYVNVTGDTMTAALNMNSVGKLDSESGDLVIYSTAVGHKGFRFGIGYIAPVDNAGVISTADTDMGYGGASYKDGYFTGDIKDASGNVKYDAFQTDNNQTGTAYTGVLADADNKTVWMSNGSANVFTIPANASVAYPTGTKLNVIMEGAGTTSITAASGVTLNGVSAGTGALSAQYQGVTLSKRATNTWIVTGSIGTVA